MCHRLGRLAIAVLVLSAGLARGAALDYPARPIRLIECFPPGGSSDLLARLLSAKLAEAFGQSIVVDNRPGAAGNIGMEVASKASPDGYTWVMGYVGTIAINPALYGKIPFDPVRDFDPVTLLTASQLVLVVHPSLAPTTVPDLIRLAKASPGKIDYASGGPGTGPHLAAELFKANAGIDLRHIPYKGSGPAMNDLIAGRVPTGFMPMLTSLGHIQAGRLRALAVTGPQRAKSAPQIPAMAETLPGFDVRTWFGLLVPARTPTPIIARIHAETARALSHPDVLDRLGTQGFEIIAAPPPEFGAFIRSEVAKWTQVIKSLAIKPD